MNILNWRKFFFRLTVVISVVGGIVSGSFAYHDGENFYFPYMIAGCLGVWIVYWIVKWLLKGLGILK